MGAMLNRPLGRKVFLGGLVAAGLVLAPVSPLSAQSQPGAASETQQPQDQPQQAQPQDQQQQQPQDQQQQQPQAPALTFEGDAGLLLMQVKPDKTGDFEAVMGKLHEAFANSDKPERKQQAAGWKIFKSTDPGPGGTVLYVAVIDPALKGADYTFAMILYEVFPTEVQQIFPVFRDAFAAGLNRVNLSLVQDFGGPKKDAPALPMTTQGSSTPMGETGATGTTGTDAPTQEPQPDQNQDQDQTPR